MHFKKPTSSHGLLLFPAAMEICGDRAQRTRQEKWWCMLYTCQLAWVELTYGLPFLWQNLCPQCQLRCPAPSAVTVMGWVSAAHARVWLPLAQWAAKMGADHSPVLSSLLRPNLKCCVQLWAIHSRKDIEGLYPVQGRAMRLKKDLDT